MGFKRWFDSRESVDSAPPLTEEEAALLAKLAAKVIQWKMTVPAILFLESVKPLNYLGAQAMVFFEPFATTIFNGREYDTFRVMIERRENVERLLQKIEELDSRALQAEKESRQQRRAGRGGPSWWRPFSGGSG